jgi:hypothetical protein
MKKLIAALIALSFTTGAAFAADEMSKDAPKADKPAASKKKPRAKAKKEAKVEKSEAAK